MNTPTPPQTRIHHIALQTHNREKNEQFFTQILGIPKRRTFLVSADLSQKLFHINTPIEVDVFENQETRIEIFPIPTWTPHSYAHLCLTVPDLNHLLHQCNKYGIEIRQGQKDGKAHIFIKDFSGNLYEIKEQPKDYEFSFIISLSGM